jgi:rubrerythrin
MENENIENKTEEVNEVIMFVRTAIQSEQDTVNQYDNLINKTTDEKLKIVFTNIRDEERKHLGELQEVLDYLTKDETKLIEEGKIEVEKVIERYIKVIG